MGRYEVNKNVCRVLEDQISLSPPGGRGTRKHINGRYLWRGEADKDLVDRRLKERDT